MNQPGVIEDGEGDTAGTEFLNFVRPGTRYAPRGPQSI